MKVGTVTGSAGAHASLLEDWGAESGLQAAWTPGFLKWLRKQASRASWG